MPGAARSSLARIEVVAGVLRDDAGRVLLAQRMPGKHLAGQWEFPGGKREPQETPTDALARELDEELGIAVCAARPWLSLTHHYPELSVRLRFFCVDDWRGVPAGREGQPLHWASAFDLSSLPMPAADRPVIKALGLDGRYLRLPEPVERGTWLRDVEQRLDEGIRLFGLRRGRLTDEELFDLAAVFGPRVRGAGGRWLFGGDPDMARRLGADGVELAPETLPDMTTRPLSDEALVTASCETAADLRRAGELGLDFVVLSPGTGLSDEGAMDDFERLCAESPLPAFAAVAGEVQLPAIRDLGGFGVAWGGASWSDS